MVDKHEFEDRLPVIYEEATGEPYPGAPLDEHLPARRRDTAEILRSVTGEDRLHFELVRELLDIEQRHRAQARRAGLFECAGEGACAAAFTTMRPTPRRGPSAPEGTLQRDVPAEPDGRA